MKLGYASHGPHNGMGPFKALFSEGVPLMSVSSLEGLDAIVLWGGEDISPSLYNEQRFRNSGPTKPTDRDVFEWECIRQATEANIPIIGICRGAQMLCAYVGGTLIQDVDGHGYGSHSVTTDTGATFLVSSCHHQMMYPYDVEHEMLAWSTNHLASVYNPPHTKHAAELDKRHVKEPEVVYFPQVNGFAIQCHPEWHNNPNEQMFNNWVLGQIKDKCFSVIKQEC